MDISNEEKLKELFQNKKEEIEKNKLNLEDKDCLLTIDLGLKIHSLKYKNELLDDKLIYFINNSILNAKMEFEQKWKNFLKLYGIEF
jgi:hypothetical protein